jgi:hypothetical protein
MYLGKSKETLDVTMGGTLEDGKLGDEGTRQKQSSSDSDSKPQSNEGRAEASSKSQTRPSTKQTLAQRSVTASGWLGGWLGRPTVQPANIPDNLETTKTSEPATATGPQALEAEQPVAAAPEEETSKTSLAHTASSSWFGLWSTAAPSAAEAPKEQVPVTIAESVPDVVIEDAPPPKRM